MKVYHGSDVEVTNVDLAHSQMYKDFGPGFYVSVDKKQARHLAKYKADRPVSKTHKAIVSVFDFDERALTEWESAPPSMFKYNVVKEGIAI